MTLKRDGAILITSIWFLAILSILATGLSFRISLDARLSKYNMDMLKAEYLARAGFMEALRLLSKDTKDYDGLRECGITLTGSYIFADNADGLFTNIKLGEGAFTVGYTEEGVRYPGMSDEERRININTAPQTVLESLFGIDQAASIMDWRDADNAPLPNGAEEGYYQALEHPYNCKNSALTAPEELLSVKGITREMFDSVEGYITVSGDGRININTASKRVFMALGMTEVLADKIIDFRNGHDKKPATKDDQVFTGVDIEKVLPALDENDVAIIGNLKNSFTTKSNYFRIDAKGMIDKSRVEKKISFVVKREEARKEAVLLSYREY